MAVACNECAVNKRLKLLILGDGVDGVPVAVSIAVVSAARKKDLLEKEESFVVRVHSVGIVLVADE